MLDTAHQELLARVSAMYYEQEMTQNQIASTLELSRVKIYRLLKEARESQIVRILIDWPIKRAAGLEARLTKQFGLDRALVLQTRRHRLGAAAAANRAAGRPLSRRHFGR